MSDTSTNLALPYIQPAQAQKHVTHNEALRRLDTLVQLTVVSVTTPTLPTSPLPGDRYVVPENATGLWADRKAELAAFEGDVWTYYQPSTGWTAWVADSAQLVTFNGANWIASTTPDLQNLSGVGIGAASDPANPLVVSGEATLLNHAGAGHQLKLNKAASSDTASLLFQTGFSGRAEMGTTGSDSLEIKVSPDGSTFKQSIIADAITGVVEFPSGVRGLAEDQFGTAPLTTTNYVIARGTDMVTNGTGYLGNNYNYPNAFDYDPITTPNLPASFAFSGYFTDPVTMTETLPVDPNLCYRLRSYLQQEALDGDFSSFAGNENHTHFMGLLCLDTDGLEIFAKHHMRYKQGGVDSKTTLTAPLAPGDTTIQLANASGWNTGNALDYARGIILYGYTNSKGYKYSDYSRLVETDLFDLAGVDKSSNTITLNRPLPTSMGNPDDPAGAWPVGTQIANSTSGGLYKYAFYSNYRPAEAGRWYKINNYIGGIDRSGNNVGNNFAPGTAGARVLWLPNYSNRAGGFLGAPDTGVAHRVWHAGVSVQPEPLAVMQTQSTGHQNIKVPFANYNASTVDLVPAGFTVQPL